MRALRLSAVPFALTLVLAAPAPALAAGGAPGGGEACGLEEPQIAELRVLFADALAEAVSARAAICAAHEAGQAPDKSEMPYAARKELGVRVAGDAAALAAVGSLAARAYCDEGASAGTRVAVLDLLAGQRAKPSAKLAGELWQHDSAPFEESHVIAFAETGGEPFLSELERRAARADESALLPAVFLAFEGSEVGRPALARAASGSLECGVATNRALAAAYALGALGDAPARRDALERVRGEALAALDEGRLAHARELALRADFFRRIDAVHEGRWIPLAWLDERVDGHCAERAPALVSADQVFWLIEEAVPLDL